jgi:hypothetical protein
VSMTAGLIWPECIDGSDEGDSEPPEFNSSGDWADWLMAITAGDADVDFDELGCAPLAAIYTDGVDDDEAVWVSPSELKAAADKLTSLIRAGRPDVRTLLGIYVDSGDTGEPVDQLVIAELEIVRRMADWAEEHAKTRLAFEIG